MEIQRDRSGITATAVITTEDALWTIPILGTGRLLIEKGRGHGHGHDQQSEDIVETHGIEHERFLSYGAYPPHKLLFMKLEAQ